MSTFVKFIQIWLFLLILKVIDMDKKEEKLRVDKYLWAIRMFKTRSLATQACKAGKVKLNGQSIKPSYLVDIGDVFTIQKGVEKKVIEVTALLARRGDYQTALAHYKDLTPKEETYAYKSAFFAPVLKRERGAGRPTKRDRRLIDKLQDSWLGEDDED